MPSQPRLGGPPRGPHQQNIKPKSAIPSRARKVQRLIKDSGELAARLIVKEASLRLPLLSAGLDSFVCRGAPQRSPREEGSSIEAHASQEDLGCVVFERSSIHLQQGGAAGEALLQKLFCLTKTNMEELYRRSNFLGIGWEDQAKQEELKHKDAVFWIVFKGSPKTREGLGLKDWGLGFVCSGGSDAMPPRRISALSLGS